LTAKNGNGIILINIKNATMIGLGFLGLVLAIFAILVVLFQILAIIDIVKSSFRESINKILWLFLVLFFPVIGTILYFTIGQDQKITE
jgi:hypothetical protein